MLTLNYKIDSCQALNPKFSLKINNLPNKFLPKIRIFFIKLLNFHSALQKILHCDLRIPKSHIVPVARLEAFRALKSIGQIGGVSGLKLSKSESFRALKFSRFGHFLTLKSIGQIGGFQGPKILQIGEFQGPKRHISSQNHYFKKENNLNRFLGIPMIYLDSQGSWAISGKF